MKFIGHLDIMRYFQKAMRRAEIPIAFSQGFSPHMIMSFANPLGVGLTSDGEYFDIELREPISSLKAVTELNKVMVDGMEVLSFVELPEDHKTGMSIVAAADYQVSLQFAENSGMELLEKEWFQKIEEAVEQVIKTEEILIMKKTKKSFKEVDIRPMIYQLSMQEEKVVMKVAAGSVENLKPDLVMEAILEKADIAKELVKLQFHRLEVYAEGLEDATFVPLESFGMEIER